MQDKQTMIQKSTEMLARVVARMTSVLSVFSSFCSFFFHFPAIRQSVSGIVLFSRGFAVFRFASLSTNHIAFAKKKKIFKGRRKTATYCSIEI